MDPEAVPVASGSVGSIRRVRVSGSVDGGRAVVHNVRPSSRRKGRIRAAEGDGAVCVCVTDCSVSRTTAHQPVRRRSMRVVSSGRAPLSIGTCFWVRG